MGFCLPETQVNTVSQILTHGVLNCFAFRWSIIQGDYVAGGPKLLSINSLGPLATESPCSNQK